MGLFSQFNTGLFNFDTSAIKGNYITTRDLYDRDGDKNIYVVRAVYKGTLDKDKRKDDLRGKEDKPTACIATDEFYINVPDFQVKEIDKMLDQPEVIDYINDGKAGVMLRTYEARGEEFVKLVFVDIESDAEV